jgi:hypothetical protein
MAILIALLLSFTSPSTLPIDLAESGCEICASSEQGGAAMMAEVLHINVVRVVTHLGESLYKQHRVVVELCSSHLQRIIYGLDYDFEPLTIRNDGLYCLLYPKRH